MKETTISTTATDHLLGFCPDVEPAPETKRSAASEPAPKAKPANGGNGYPFRTKGEILAQLATDDHFLLECLAVLDRRQTEDEREEKETKYRNRRGWMSSHAVNGTELAAKARSEGLSPEELDKARGMVCRYSKQLASHFRAEAVAADPAKADKAVRFFLG